MTFLSRRSAVALLGGSLAGCGGGWFGEEDEGPPLPGVRKPVLLLERGAAADPETASVPILLPQPVRNPDWAQPGGSARHALEHPAGPSALNLAWRADIGSGDGGRLPAPVVSGGRVVVMDGDSRVTALDAGSGRTLWSMRPDGIDEADTLMAGGVSADPARIYAAAGTGMLVALDAASGTEAWRADLKVPLRAGPAVAGDRLLLTTADNQTLCLSIVDGAEIWRHLAFSQGAAFVGGSAPAIEEDVAVAAYGSGDVVGLAVETGQVLWCDSVLRPRRTIALAAIGDIEGLPVIDNGRVYVAGNGGETAAFELRDGNRVWDQTLASPSTPWVAGDFLWLVTDRGEMVCLLRANGRIRWVAPLPAVDDGGDPSAVPTRWAGPVLAGGRLIAARSDGRLFAFSPQDGSVLGDADLGAPMFAGPVVADATVYALNESAELRAFR